MSDMTKEEAMLKLTEYLNAINHSKESLMSDMTKEEAIEKARVNYMNCYWDQETKLSNLYDECDELKEGDLDEFKIGD